nr:MAG TPA: hypothetical protein [Caudoviricetes sp.]
MSCPSTYKTPTNFKTGAFLKFVRELGHLFII